MIRVPALLEINSSVAGEWQTCLLSQTQGLHVAVRLQDDNDSWLNYLPATVTTLKTVTLLSTSAVCAGLAWLGGSMLFYILLSRYFSPEAAHHSRSLYFDYTKADAVATAHFLPDIQYNRAMLSAVSP